MGNCKDCKCPRRRGGARLWLTFAARILDNGRASAAKRSVLVLSGLGLFQSSASGLLSARRERVLLDNDVRRQTSIFSVLQKEPCICSPS